MSHLRRPASLENQTPTFLTDTLRDAGWTPCKVEIDRLANHESLAMIVDEIMEYGANEYKLLGNTMWIKDQHKATLFMLKWA
jgi:hypothetical protein